MSIEKVNSDMSDILDAGHRAKVLGQVRDFYNELPFNFDKTGRQALLRIKKNPIRSYPELCKLLDAGLINNSIEYGCGTGWFSASLARHWNVDALALDLSDKAIERARSVVADLELSEKVQIKACDIFEYPSASESRDLVASVGVLHHTADCKAAFQHICKSVSKNGFVFVGLYHLYGRKVMLEHYWDMIRTQGEAKAAEQYRLMHATLEDETLTESWFRDQILHPHETQHTFEEVAQWVDVAGLHLVGTSINDYGQINDREAIIKQEKEYAQISYVRNVLQKTFFPGFFTVLASSRPVAEILDARKHRTVSKPIRRANDKARNILGISAFYHDSAATIVQDGQVVAAAQEERFSRKVHDLSFPRRAIASCLDMAGLTPDDLDLVVFYDDPKLKLQRITDSCTSHNAYKASHWWPVFKRWLGAETPLYAVEHGMEKVAGQYGGIRFNGPVKYESHHRSHAASAFFPSPYEEAAILTMDGVGEYATTSISVGRGKSIEMLKQIDYPHSLGLLYSAFTGYLGFKVNSGEYKVMGLAPYGEPVYVKQVESLVHWHADGSYRLALDYFDYFSSDRMTNKKFHELFGGPPRKAESRLTQRECDIARSLQVVIEDAVLRLARHAREVTGMKNLCLAGGVALNCVANGKLVKEGVFDDVWIQPASGDAGGALGAALLGYYAQEGTKRVVEPDDGRRACLGPAFSNDQIEVVLQKAGYPHVRMADDELIPFIARKLSEGQVIGWFSGPMEFGPRALGYRSIIADARSTTMQSIVNTKVKFRESFRPFAPIVLEDKAKEWFDLGVTSPYMLLVGDILPQHVVNGNVDRAQLPGTKKMEMPYSTVPAVTHVDGSARLQTVSKSSNPRIHNLLKAFEVITGCPILLNTSFNVRDSSIVCSPEDAYECFMETDIDWLVMGDFVLRKEDQPAYYGRKPSLYSAFRGGDA